MDVICYIIIEKKRFFLALALADFSETMCDSQGLKAIILQEGSLYRSTIAWAVWWLNYAYEVVVSGTPGGYF